MRHNNLALLVLWLLAQGAAMLWLDRPLANWLHDNLGAIPVFRYMAGLGDFPAPVATIILSGAGIAAYRGWRPGPWGRTFLAAALAVVIALVIKDQLKYLFGRTWPETWINNNPSWIKDGVFAFMPLHGGQGWSAFPSGHTTLITAPMAVFWLARPRLRWLWASPVAIVAIGLLGANYHWLSDIIAGGGLGLLAGWGSYALLRPTEPSPVL